MGNPIVIACPECDKEIKAPEEAIGKKIRCKACDHVFVVKAPPSKAAPKVAKAIPAKPAKAVPAKAVPAKAVPAKPVPPRDKKPADEDDDGVAKNPYGMVFEDMAARCPNCANKLESEDAVICLHCGYNTVTREQARTRKVREVTGLDHFLWLLPGILCVITIFTLLGYCCYHHWVLPTQLFDNWKDLMEKHQDRRLTIDDQSIDWTGYFFHPFTELWGGVFTLYMCWLCGKFAWKRLVKHPRPPEIEERMGKG